MKSTTRILSGSTLIPLAVMILITMAMFLLARGRARKMNEQKVSLLAPAEAEQFIGETEKASCLICYDGEDDSSIKLAENAVDVLNRLHVRYQRVDLSKEDPDFSFCRKLLFCSGDAAAFSEKAFEQFASWIDSGDLFWLCTPTVNNRFRMIYRKLGIADTDLEYLTDVNGLSFEGGFIPGLDGRKFPNLDLNDVSLAVQIENDCSVYVRDSGTGAPLIWSKKRNEGGLVTVFNNNIMYASYNLTGMLAAAYINAAGTFVWPVINAEAVFIDDFPAPQPEGFDERLKEQFGYDTQGFFRNVWWPDMKELADKHGLLYTGVLIEDYNENTSPPFSTGSADSLLQYYGADLLSTGGEIALHGYNHQPLIPMGYPTEDNYKGWPSAENMAASLDEINTYAARLFPEVTFLTYVPPSNNLSSVGYQVLTKKEKALRVVSGVYYDEEEGTCYRTDFTETKDGIVQFPRISSGFSIDEAVQLRMYCMLYMQGVVSHFIHPDDVLDDDRGAKLGWEQLYKDFDETLTDINNRYTGIRALTAASAAGAVQRCNRASVSMESTDREMIIKIGNFRDEVWLAFYSREKIPKKAAGAEVFQVSDGLYWLRCTNDVVNIEL